MTRLNFQVRSSSSNEIYDIRVLAFDGGLTMTCTCPAGTNGQHCKHRIGILDGDISALALGSAEDVAHVARLMPGTALEAAYHAKLNADLEVDAAKRKAKKASVALGRAFLGE